MQEKGEHIGQDAPMQFVVRASSRDRLWSGIEAKIYETSGGSSQVGPIPHCCITLHLSARRQVSGDIDLLPPGSYAAWRDENETLMFAVTLHKSVFCAAAHSMGIDPDRIAIPPRMHVRDPHIEHIALALMAELESEDRFGRVYAESLGVALASHLLRRYLHPASGNVPTGISHGRIRRVLDYVHDNFSKDLSLDELAQVANLSPSHFKVVFKEAIGIPVHQYIIRHRVEQAVQLIARNELPLTEIATLVGFSSQSHMARFIRRIAGASPAQIRGSIDLTGSQ